MSNVYNTAPPTKGKVVIKTSLGDLDVELWPKESPLAVRNFVQLCLEGYYDGTVFHRLIKGFILQGGDPSGNGSGGESIYGAPFKDEFHSRLHFQYRGILACANAQTPHSNGSQFFITLDKADGLEKKNTIFGKVTGDSIYNLLRLAEVEVDDDDRPLLPPVILETEVLWNPFEDIVPRTTREDRAAADEERRSIEATKQRAAVKAAAAGKKKNLSLLSFGEDEDADEEGGGGAGPRPAAQGSSKIRSAHDVLEDERLAREEETPVDERIDVTRRRAPVAAPDDARAGAVADIKSNVQRAAADGERARGDASNRGGDGEDDEEDGGGAPRGDGGGGFAGAMHAKAMERRQRLAASGAAAAAAAGDGEVARSQRSPGREDDDGEGGGRGGGGGGGSGREPEGESAAARRRRREELAAMKADPGNAVYGKIKTTDEVADADLLKPWQLNREKYKQKKRLVGDREKDTLAKMARFTQALRAPQPARAAAADGPAAGSATAAAAAATATAAASLGDEEDEGYAGKVDAKLDHRTYMPAAWRAEEYWCEGEEGEEAGIADLRGHELVFAKDAKKRAMDRSDDVNDYVVIDPLLEAGKAKFSKLLQKNKKLETEWGKGKAGGTTRD